MGALVTGVQTCALPISAGGSCHRLEAEQKGQSAVPLTMISLRAGFLHLGGTMGRPHPLDGAAVAIGQLCRFGNALARFAQCHNAGVRCPIAFAPSAAPCGLCQGDTLALSLAAIGVIVVSPPTGREVG